VSSFPSVALSDPAELDIVGYRGDSGQFRVTVTQGGSPLDVSAAEWDCDVRSTPDGPVLATLTVTPVVGTTNAVDVILPADQSALITGSDAPDAEVATEFIAAWDLEMTLSGKTTTLLRGSITMTKDVSRPAFEVPEPPEAMRATPPTGALPPPPLGGGVLVHAGPDVD
jgi:hypothetical protein